MATVTITLTDDGSDGALNVRFESDPAWPGPAAEDQSLTNAQMAGLQLMDALKHMTEGCGEGCGHDHGATTDG